MIGYSGTGYKGMQIMPNERTIEGDLFQAFVKAGAISKANADDPKKSQLIRCARTDKGVHAAGNVISLKLIIEDADIVEKINNNLPEQIRVWGYERTTGSFSSYAQCDSRWYEYLIPTYAFLPPHPTSWMAKELKRISEEDGKVEEYNGRQKEVLGFWDDVEENAVKPLLEAMDPETRALVESALYYTDSVSLDVLKDDEDDIEIDEETGEPVKPKKGSKPKQQPSIAPPTEEAKDGSSTLVTAGGGEIIPDTIPSKVPAERSESLELAIKSVKNAYIEAKNAYRIQPERVERIKDVLSRYEGTHNYHNFTIKKNPKDASAKRFIRSFQVNGDPVLINGTEWLSLKVHGQSFMMHQIRKMVAMVALIVRSGCDTERITQALGMDVFNIPKAPGLGLLLERPVFETYNQKAESFEKNELSFDKYEKEMLEFKQREIYDKIFQEEAQNHV
jgi:tRNA pseudouridine38-40 synthase